MPDVRAFIRTYPGAIDDSLVRDLLDLEGGERCDLDVRRCRITPVRGEVLDRFNKAVSGCFSDYRTLATTLGWCSLLELPNVLRYEQATRGQPALDWFHEHADAWDVPSSTRQVSVVAYLNDVAIGGETEFPSLEVSQRCEKGTILMFPSNFIYHHVARPAVSGPKMVVVTWIHFGNGGNPTYLTTPLL